MSRYLIENYAEDEYYLNKMKEILESYPKLGPLGHPSKLLEHVYIGNQDNADNLDLLQALEITHVLNCAGTRTFDLTRSPYRKDTGIVGFLMMPAEDYEEFDIMQYFMDAIIFLDKVKTAGGRALVHCNIGVNRSGAIAAAYLMVHQKRPLLKVTEDLKSKRSLILQNEGFRRQLVRFARCRGLLDIPERPPQKPSFNYSAYISVSSRPRESSAVATSQEKSENTKNGNSNPPEEESSKDTSETVNSEQSSGEQQLSKETSAEQNSGSVEERKSPLPPNSNGTVGKYAGYESDIRNLDDKNESVRKDVPRLEVPNMESIREELDKAFNKLSHLDLGNSRRPAKTEHLSPNKSASSISFSASNTDLDYPPLSSSRSLDLPANAGERHLSSKLSALSLELPHEQIRVLPRHTYSTNSQNFASDLLYPGDHNPTFRISGVDKIVSPAPSFTQHLSRESSISDMTNSLYASLDDDEFSRKYVSVDKDRSPLITSALGSNLDYEDLRRNHSNINLSKGTAKNHPASDRFVSSVKPLSYYQRMASLNSARHQLDDTADDEFTFASNVRSGFERPSSKSRPFYESGEGMLFTPYLATSHKSSNTIPRNCFSYNTLSTRPMSIADRAYTTETSYPGNTPYNRMSLSDLDSLGSYDFPLRTTNGYHTSYRPQSSGYRSAMEYDNAVDEYSDLLDASLGRSNTLGAVVKSRVSTGGGGTSSRKFYKY